MKEGTWAVRYKDGTIQAQFDKNSPGFLPLEDHPFGGEVPFKAIEWENVEAVLFHSQEDIAEYKVLHTPQWQVSLRSRVFQKIGGAIRAFVLLVSEPGKEINADSVKSAVYWFPNGVTHQCFHFDCPDVKQWASRAALGEKEGLMPVHDKLSVEVDADLVN